MIKFLSSSLSTETMKREVNAGVDFLKRLAIAHGKLDEARADVFGEKLQKILLDKYDGHWYPESPSRGQAFRYCPLIYIDIRNTFTPRLEY